MGSAVCAVVANDASLELVAAVDSFTADESRFGVAISHDLRAFADARCDVVVDFTVAESARVTLPWLAMHGIHAVVGTTGLDEHDLDVVRSAFGKGPAHCIIAPNFSISAVLMMRFAEIAAPFFDTAEIIEYHHESKVDAPSGTALATAQRMGASRDTAWAEDQTQNELLPGSRGGLPASGVRIHSVRMRGMIAHQDVIFGALGQSLTVRQDSYDRSSFMPGVLLACKQIATHPGVTLGLDRYLEI